MNVRAYDIFLAGLSAHGAGIREDEERSVKESVLGAPLFLIDDIKTLYEYTVENSDKAFHVDGKVSKAMRAEDFPPLTMPFEKFAVEWERDGEPAWFQERALCVVREDKRVHFVDGRRFEMIFIACSSSAQHGPRYIVEGQADLFIDADGKIVKLDHMLSKAVPGADSHVGYGTGMVAFALSLMSCRNVTRRERGLSRTARRHPGPFSQTVGDAHYTLDIPGAADFRSLSGVAGDEAKRKRLHIVRGHFADYSEGGGLFGKLHGRYYIAPHVRGSADVGTVHKDYRVVA